MAKAYIMRESHRLLHLESGKEPIGAGFKASPVEVYEEIRDTAAIIASGKAGENQEELATLLMGLTLDVLNRWRYIFVAKISRADELAAYKKELGYLVDPLFGSRA